MVHFAAARNIRFHNVFRRDDLDMKCCVLMSGILHIRLLDVNLMLALAPQQGIGIVPILSTIKTMGRGGRVVEGARLESVYTGNRIAGSNPAPSATLRLRRRP